MGGFSSVFHAIQSAYGWSDKKILRLRIKRLVQIMHVLRADMDMTAHIRRSEIEWQTRVLAIYISHTVDDGDAAQKLIDSAMVLSMTGGDEEPALADTSSRGDTRTLEEIMEHGNTEAAFAHNARRKGPGLPFMN